MIGFSLRFWGSRNALFSIQMMWYETNDWFFFNKALINDQKVFFNIPPFSVKWHFPYWQWQVNAEKNREFVSRIIFPFFQWQNNWLLHSCKATDISKYCLITSSGVTSKVQCAEMTVDGGQRVKLFPPHVPGKRLKSATFSELEI